MANYDIVYGSLGAIIALLTWTYLIAWITIFGAHLSASVAAERVNRKLAEKVEAEELETPEKEKELQA